MTQLPRGVVATMGDVTVAYEDVILAGMLDEAWDSFVAWTAEGALRCVDADVDATELRREAEAFRRARRLEAGQALRAWLAEREVTLGEWEAHLRRRVLLGKAFSSTERATPLPQAFVGSLRVDSFCNRFWELGAKRIIRWIAASRLLDDTTDTPTDVSSLVEAALADEVAGLGDKGKDWCRDHFIALSAWSGANDRLGESVATESAIKAVVDANWDAWCSLRLDVCRLGSEPAAREALVCATEDGDGPEEIARRAHAASQLQLVRGRDLEAGILPLLLHAAIDEPCGPFRLGTEWAVIWVRARVPADPADPEVRAVALEALVDAALKSALRGAVTWDAPV